MIYSRILRSARQRKLKLLDIGFPEEIQEETATTAKLKEKNRIPTEIGLSYCTHLFRVKRMLNELSPKDHRLPRLELEVPVWERTGHGLRR